MAFVTSISVYHLPGRRGFADGKLDQKYGFYTLAVFASDRTALSLPYMTAFLARGIFLGLVPLFFSLTFRLTIIAIPLIRLLGFQTFRVIGDSFSPRRI